MGTVGAAASATGSKPALVRTGSNVSASSSASLGRTSSTGSSSSGGGSQPKQQPTVWDAPTQPPTKEARSSSAGAGAGAGSAMSRKVAAPAPAAAAAAAAAAARKPGGAPLTRRYTSQEIQEKKRRARERAARAKANKLSSSQQ